MDAAEAPDLQAQLAAAVHALNHGAHPSERLAANQWLLGLQRSPQAWALAVSLLASGDHAAPSARFTYFQNYFKTVLNLKKLRELTMMRNFISF